MCRNDSKRNRGVSSSPKIAWAVRIPPAIVGEAEREQEEAGAVARVEGKRVGSLLAQSGVTREHLLAGSTEQHLPGQASPGDESPGSITAPHK